jgi:predicted transposase YbfD/YdcC
MTSMLSVDFSTGDQDAQLSLVPIRVEAASIYKIFENIIDTRKDKGKRYPLSFLLTLVTLAKMAGETTIDGIVDWIDHRKNDLKKMLNWPKVFPSNKTYERVLSQCDHEQITEAISGLILKVRAEEKCASEPSRLLHHTSYDDRLVHTAMDGKTLRGTLNHVEETQPSVRILSLYECDNGVTVKQYVYKNNESETSAVEQLLRSNIIRNRIISTDALHTNRRWCANVQLFGGYYLTTVKENTPNLYHDLVIYFSDDEILNKECQYYKKVQKGHGRLEVREIWTSSYMNSYFARDWYGIAQIFMIRKTVTEKGEKKITIRYGITSLPQDKANAQKILKIRQDHENRSHYRRDVTLAEDASQVRINGAPEVLAAINTGILSLMDFIGVKNLAKQTRYYNAKPREAIKLLFAKLSR